MRYRHCGARGLQLPAISPAVRHNFGDTSCLEDARAVVRRAFDLGVDHFDLSNNYGDCPRRRGLRCGPGLAP
jgi:L-glyceraldehyde 3-phosphate reductase